MPSIKIANQATSANALTGLKAAKISRPSLVSMWCAAVTVTDTVGFSIGDRELLVQTVGNPNIEVAADIVSVNTDQMVFSEPAEAGEELFMPVTTGTAVGLLVVVDEL